jgi:hypothetical protein
LLAGSGDSVEAMAAAALGPGLLSRESLDAHLRAGDFFLVLDGLSESGPAPDVLARFVRGPFGRATPLLLAGRPGRGYAAVVREGGHWMTVEPRPLDDGRLREFVTAYGGTTLSDAVRSACREGDGAYSPLLVRMALVVNPRGDGPVGVADLYRAYFLKALEGQLPAEADRLRRLEDASRWCLETYWKDGLRRRRYDPADGLQRQLRQAGLLVPADTGEPPKEVVFAPASMQTSLTAHGLAAGDRGRALLRAATDPMFAGELELFRMCLATFAPRDDLRQWLRGELARWGEARADELVDEAAKAPV